MTNQGERAHGVTPGLSRDYETRTADQYSGQCLGRPANHRPLEGWHPGLGRAPRCVLCQRPRGGHRLEAGLGLSKVFHEKNHLLNQDKNP
jgi:hypothetical protein